MATNDVIKSSQARLLAIGEGVRQRFLGAETWGNCATEADRLWRIATRFQTSAASLQNITPELRDASQDNALALLELKHKAGALPASGIIPERPVGDEPSRTEVASILVSPYRWLAEVSSPILYRQAEIQGLFKDLANAPGAALAWTLRQALVGLGLPEWALPALGVVAVAGAGLFAYNTFLAPVGRPVRLLRKAGSRGAGWL